MVTMMEKPRQTDTITQFRYSWFTTFLIAYQADERKLNLRCLGCRELIKLDFKKPSHIRGVIEFNGLYVPVIDPAILLLNRPTPLNNLSCILITPHRWEHQQFYTGIVIEDIDEIMEFATSEPGIGPLRDISVNIRFVLDMRKNAGMESWLYENHQILETCRREYQPLGCELGDELQQQGYIDFKQSCSEESLDI
ncbi:MAG: hypothetical protein ABSB91_00050 [Sedimentisphaerales bacterium]|jgi:hypothetical protein